MSKAEVNYETKKVIIEIPKDTICMTASFVYDSRTGLDLYTKNYDTEDLKRDVL